MKVTDSLIKTVDNLFSANDEFLDMAQEEEGSINRAVQAMETQLQHVELSSNGSYREISDNIAVEVREVPSEDFRSGIGFGSFVTNSESDVSDDEDEIIMVLDGEENIVQARPNAVALIVLPQEIFDEGLEIEQGKIFVTHHE